MATNRRVSWGTQPPQAIENLLAAFESDTRTLSAFAAYRGIAAAGFRQAAIKLFPDRMRAALAAKVRKSTPYARGRAFEYRVMHDLARRGFQVMRSPGSRGPADLIAVAVGQQLYVQAKVDGRITPEERTKFVELTSSIAARALLAERKDGRTLRYFDITAAGIGSEVFPCVRH